MKYLLPIMLVLASCTTERATQVDAVRTSRTIATTVRQVILPDQQIVELTERTVTVVDENTGTSSVESVETSPPKIIGQIGQVLNTVGRAAAVGVAGPAGGNVWDTLWPAVTAAGTAAAGGGLALHNQIKARRRAEEEAEETERALRQTVKGVQDAKVEMSVEQKELLREALGSAQDESVKARIMRIKDGLPLRRSP